MIGIPSVVPIIGVTKKQILKKLHRSPSHGYELAKRLDLSVTGIYQHLKDLSGEGFIEQSHEGRRKVYSLTPKGESLIRALED